MDIVKIEDYLQFMETLDQYPWEYVENNSVIKLRETDDSLEIGVVDIENQALLKKLRYFHKDRECVFLPVEKSELTSFLAKRESGYEESGRQTPDEGENDLNKLANDAPVINLVNSIIIDGINKNASDIHIEAFATSVLVRYRIDGVLHPGITIEKSRFSAVSSRIKIMTNLNIMERRLPQDGRCSVNIGEQTVDLRISIVPISNGESIVMRIFKKKETPLTLEDLGFKDRNLDLMEKMYSMPHGLVLVTGPTGSGKTTTLNAVLQKINSTTKKIITIEDPVEYNIEGIDQIQVNEKIGLTFESILRRVLRQDPDIIMIGEIRDKETAELVVRASLTGHLVFSTLHTNDSVSAISRLKDIGVPSYLISAVLRGVFAQRLVRRLCPHCKALAPVQRHSRAISELSELREAWFPVGCKHCGNTGYRGRIAVLEGFEFTEDIEDLTASDAKINDIRNYLYSKGMKNIIKNGLKKILEGITSIEEIERVVLC